ncbi:sulfurtransferase complex subunit TusB [Pseudoteredinibacter isoporae]|uniref:Sulfur relay protein TusB/DsrH n=1 Tax=Pseudoteredinibacter isoporae TaxID=570281 RepID=A0A7X0MW19_9GAMM|nr:sulfurtransferase complex subunit TusB [Pseudoteredinibacter isoporae]MBB6521973.1 sulfur relay protein TusB/DsrH [Pseudoteredinibacter isoporae]NHO87509.1 sulfurtransferase complex subunit TusB [Pseudoteredinibacter isoporae]NIB24160.1 sulfurtransferase complex subunit TusB [Pseudoteredinibacter isoporae]
MSSLHILNTANSEPWQSCQTLCQAGDAIVFYADGVALTLQEERLRDLIDKGVKCYALQDDCLARGLSPKPDLLELIDYDIWVSLSTQYKNSPNWS